jgi:hypothetical protein
MFLEDIFSYQKGRFSKALKFELGIVENERIDADANHTVGLHEGCDELIVTSRETLHENVEISDL